VSALSFGAWITFGPQCSEKVAEECMLAAYNSGVNFFDNAEVYGHGTAEIFMGNIIKRLGCKRSDLVISTKIFWGGNGPNDCGLSRGVDMSLRRLKMDYVDLIFCHRPDPHTPIEETVRAMNHVIDHGKAFYWGTSEWSAQEITEAHDVANQLGLIGPLMEQPQYNMLHRSRVEKEYLPLYKNYGMGTTIWSPLASGLLTGKYRTLQDINQKDTRLSMENEMKWLRDQLLSGQGLNGLEENNFEAIVTKVGKLNSLAQELGCTVPQLALAWCLKNPHVSTVITGASRQSQVVENMEALKVVAKITDGVNTRIEEILKNKPTPARDWR
jgi:voltage-dependent potassium channel beta subunit